MKGLKINEKLKCFVRKHQQNFVFRNVQTILFYEDKPVETSYITILPNPRVTHVLLVL